MPKIGLRIIKSAIAVFICFIIYIVRGEGLPFYSTIAAIMCMQPGISNTRKASRNRIMGTFVGGIFGMILLVFERKYMTGAREIYRFILISIAIIPVIYTSILLEHKQASHTSCVVFLSIVVNHATDVSPYSFTISRIIDTLIGVIVAIGINGVKIPRKKNKDILFITEVEDVLINSKEHITNYSKVKINEAIEDGALITLATNKTVAEMISIIEDIHINLPIITMDGAAIYDLKNKSYCYIEDINHETSLQIIDIIREAGINFFANTIVNDVIHIYYDEFKNPIEKEYYDLEKLLPMKNYILTNLPKGRRVATFTIIDKVEKLQQIREIISKKSFIKGIRFVFEDYSNGYKTMKIISAKATKENAIVELKNIIPCEKIITFTNKNGEIFMTRKLKSDHENEGVIEERKELIYSEINSNNLNTVVKSIDKLFYLN